MPRLTVMIAFGTRPEAIKLAPLILEMQRAGSLINPVVCNTGQHREMLAQVLDWFKIKPAHDLELMQVDQTLSSLTSRTLDGLTRVIQQVRPHAVMVQGDTTSAMAASLAAFYARIPVAHVEAGLRTGDMQSPFPEEMNRRFTTLLTTFHFTPTPGAAEALLRENVPARTIFTVGNTVIDALRLTRERLNLSPRNNQPRQRKNILVTAHRRESFGSPFEEICRAIRDLADRNNSVEITYPVHLNPNVRDPVSRWLTGHSRIRLLEPLRYEEFVRHMLECDLILTDSGGVQEEAAALGKPTLVLRGNTERSEAIAAGNAMLVSSDRQLILSVAGKLLSDDQAYQSMCKASDVFGDGFAAGRIIQILNEQVSGRETSA